MDRSSPTFETRRIGSVPYHDLGRLVGHLTIKLCPVPGVTLSLLPILLLALYVSDVWDVSGERKVKGGVGSKEAIFR